MITHDLISSNAAQTTQYGIQVTTGTMVTELPDMPGTAQLDTAINMVGFGIGSPHPDFSQYYCTDINAYSEGPNEVKIVYTWEYKFPEVRYEINSGVGSEQTNMDKDGLVITTTYTYPDSYKEQPELAGEEYTTSVMVDKLVCETTLTITRQELVTGLTLLAYSKLYTGKLNSSTWGLIGDGPRQWLCTGISGSSADNGVTYTVNYNFAYRPDKVYLSGTYPNQTPQWRSGWDKEIVFIDPRTDQPPEDATITVKQIYDTIDFNNLGLV